MQVGSSHLHKLKWSRKVQCIFIDFDIFFLCLAPKHRIVVKVIKKPFRKVVKVVRRKKNRKCKGNNQLHQLEIYEIDRDGIKLRFFFLNGCIVHLFLNYVINANIFCGGCILKV